MKQNIDLGRLFRALDRRVLVMILIGIVAIVGVRAFFVSPSQNNLVKAKLERTETLKATQDLEKRVDDILSSGTGNIEQIIAELTSWERSLNRSVDDLMFTEAMYTSAQGYVTLDSVTKTESAAEKKEGVQYVEYMITGTGSYDNISKWTERVRFFPGAVVTVKSVDLSVNAKLNPNAVTPGNRDTVPLISVNEPGTRVDFSVTLLAWFDASQRVLATDEDLPLIGLPDGGNAQQPGETGVQVPNGGQNQVPGGSAPGQRNQVPGGTVPGQNNSQGQTPTPNG